MSEHLKLIDSEGNNAAPVITKKTIKGNFVIVELSIYKDDAEQYIASTDDALNWRDHDYSYGECRDLFKHVYGDPEPRPTGPKVQCKGHTKSTGDRCKRNTTNDGGYCDDHYTQNPERWEGRARSHFLDDLYDNNKEDFERFGLIMYYVACRSCGKGFIVLDKDAFSAQYCTFCGHCGLAD
jgi:hypothetical protein